MNITSAPSNKLQKRIRRLERARRRVEARAVVGAALAQSAAFVAPSANLERSRHDFEPVKGAAPVGLLPPPAPYLGFPVFSGWLARWLQRA